MILGAPRIPLPAFFMILWTFYLIPRASPRDSETSCTTWFIIFHTESPNLLLCYPIQLWSFEVFNPFEGSVCESSFPTFCLLIWSTKTFRLINSSSLSYYLTPSPLSSSTICYWMHFITLRGGVSTPIKCMPFFPWTSSSKLFSKMTNSSILFQIWSQADVLPPWKGDCLDSGF